MEKDKIDIQAIRAMFNGLIEDPTILEIDKEIEELKIPEEKDFII